MEEMLGRKDWKRGWNNKWRRDRDGRVGKRLVLMEGLEEWMRMAAMELHRGKMTGNKWKKGEGNGRVG